jgi:hypothetical protein
MIVMNRRNDSSLKLVSGQQRRRELKSYLSVEEALKDESEDVSQ